MYPYCPLDSSRREVRVLQWDPSEDENDDRVRCKLIHVSLDESLKYDALSYAWGSPEPSQGIVVDGVEVSVGPNLFAALKQIRHGKRPLWVDALCINQGDQQERGDQVYLMGDIYKEADVVFMWLGDDEDNGEAALGFLKDLQDQLKTAYGSVSKMMSDQEIEETRNTVKTIMSDQEFDEPWNAVSKLFQRPYWSRVWIIQEVLLASNPVVCCGAEICSWYFFQFFLCIFDSSFHIKLSAAAENALLYASMLARPLARLHDQKSKEKRMSLIDCLVLGRQRKATDPRDHIYGMLNLVEAAGIVPDYTISVDTLYRSVAQRIIEQVKNLDILSACVNDKIEVQTLIDGGEISIRSNYPPVHFGTNPGATTISKLTKISNTVLVGYSKLPSWVPDWKVQTNDRKYMFLAKEECKYQASRQTLARIHFDEKNSAILTVEGFVLDEVLSVSPRNSNDDDDVGDGSAHADSIMEDWAIWESANPDDCPYGDLTEQELAFERTFCLGTDYGNFEKSTMTKMIIKKASENEDDYVEDEDDYDDTSLDAIYRDYFKEDIIDGQYGAANRRFVVTKKGYMGRGPLPVRDGDIVAILFGAKVPFMLRKFKDNYILLGECYIHGVMDGEAMDALDKGIYDVQEFRLQ